MKKAKIDNLKLWRQFKRAKTEEEKIELRKQLIIIYYPLVKKIAYSFAKRIQWKVTPEELASFGFDGLFTCINNFNISRKINFKFFASRRILGSIIDEVRRQDPISRSTRKNHAFLEKIRHQLESEQGKKVTEEEIIKKAGLNLRDFRRNLKKYHPISFSSIEGSNICDPSKQEDFQQDSNNNLIDTKTSSSDSKILRTEFLSKILSRNFSIIEQKIIYMYYYENLTMDNISVLLNMSESRISQIHRDVLVKLKEKIKRNPTYFDKYISKYISSCKDTGPLF